MPELPPWIMNLIYAILGAIGVMIPKLFKIMSDRSQVVSDDRSEFTNQILTRLSNLEGYLQNRETYHSAQLDIQARQHREDMLEMKRDYEHRLEARDRIIGELRERQSHLERLVKNYHDGNVLEDSNE